MTRRLFIDKPPSAPVSRTSAGGRIGGVGERLRPVESCRLRLELPVALPTRLLAELGAQSLLGARLELAAQDARSCKTNGETLKAPLRLCFYDVERLLVEALDFEPGKSLLSKGLLPIAGCGRRTARVYCVSLSSHDDAYALSYVDPEAPETDPEANERREANFTLPLVHVSGVRLTLENVLELAQLCPGAALRRRLLRKKRGRRSPFASDDTRAGAMKQTGARNRISRTLDLFH